MSIADERLYPLLPSTTKRGAHTFGGELLSAEYSRQTETHRKPTAIFSPPSGTSVSVPPHILARVPPANLEPLTPTSTRETKTSEGHEHERGEGEVADSLAEDGFVRHKVRHMH